MRGVLIAYSLPPGTDKTRSSALSKRLYGQRTSSHGGRYTYWRKGLLDGIPYVKLIRGAIIVRKEDSKRVIRFLRDCNADVHTREVILTSEDENALSTRKPLH